MLEHFGLTRDRDWLAKNAAKLNANADWMIQQRKDFWKAIPGHERLWADGLLPPHNIWDSRVWRSWYESNASYCHAVARHAEVIAEVDPEAGRRYAEEAGTFRKDLLAAVEKSLDAFAGDPRARRNLPFLPAAGAVRARPGQPVHARQFRCGRSSAPCTRRGCTPTPSAADRSRRVRPLPADDPRVQGYLDVLEDRLLSENFKICLRFSDYDPQKDWFSRSGWYYQCGLERTANIHLQQGRSGLFPPHLAEPVRRGDQSGSLDISANTRPRTIVWTSPSRRRRFWNGSGTCSYGRRRLLMAGPGDAAGMARPGQEDLDEQRPDAIRHGGLRNRLRRGPQARSRRPSRCLREIRQRPCCCGCVIRKPRR